MKNNFPFKLVLLCIILIHHFSGLSQELTVAGSRIESTVSTTISVGTSSQVSTPTPINGNYQDLLIQDFVIMGINHNYEEFITEETSLAVELKITPLGGNPNPSFFITLNLDYKPFQDQDYQDKEVYLFSNESSYEIEINQITIDGVTSTILPKNVYIEPKITYERIYDLTALSNSEVTGVNNTTSDIDGDGVKDLIEINWTPMPEAIEYQLEWTFVNSYDGIGSSVYTSRNYDFKNNNTRITTTQNSYEIPLIFERGFLVYRVRAVGRSFTQPSNRIYGSWGSVNELGTVGSGGSVATTNFYEVTHPHEENKNWQVATTFAEEGKKKEVASYYDGSLRNRQSVTKVNTDNNTIVGETIYDNQGRPAINVLPVPVQNDDPENPIKFYPEFNKNTSDSEYNRDDFDKDVSECETTVNSMNSSSGAAKYYSSNNNNQIEEQSYVPDSKGYPFTTVEYTPDNTGRIRRQSGVGADFRLDSDRESKYFYGTPYQIELDRLFGSEVGYNDHYKKNMVRDPNGQISISYLDQEGRVIATSLAGNKPENLSKIDSYTNASVLLNSELISPTDANTTSLGNVNKMVITEEFLVASENVVKFTYNMSSDMMLETCLPSVCSHCVYDLKVTLKDDCGNPVYNTDPTPVPIEFYQVLGHYTYDAVDDIYNYSTDCADGDFNLSNQEYEALLPVGNYQVVKELTIREEALDFYLNEYLNNNCTETLSDFQDAAILGIDYSSCNIDCSTCASDLGSLNDFVTQGLGTSDEYHVLLEECEKLCDEYSMCKIAHMLMLQDVSPEGQYGFTDLSSTVSTDVLKGYISVFSSYNPVGINNKWRYPDLNDGSANPNLYLDADGTPSLIVVQVDPISQTVTPPVISSLIGNIPQNNNGDYVVKPQELLNVEDFLTYWKDSWAQSLLIYHPEYCYYQECLNYEMEDANGKSSNSFNSYLLGLDFTSADTDNILVESAGVYSFDYSSDPFVNTSLNQNNNYNYGSASTYNAVTAMQLAYDNYFVINGTTYSMYEVAAGMANCGNNFPSGGASCLTITTSSTNQVKDKFWEYISAFYTSKKEQIIAERMHRVAVENDCSNACIGEDQFSPLQAGLITPSTGGLSGISNSGYYTVDQACSFSTYQFYNNAQKRFFIIEDELEADINVSEYELYYATGKCPKALYTENFFNELISLNNLTSNYSNADNLSSTLPLYLEIQGSTTTIPSYDYNATLTNTGTGAGILNFDLTITSFGDIISGTLNNANISFDWSEVIQLYNFKPDPSSTNPNDFLVTASIEDVNGTITSLELDGTLNHDIKNCTFPEYCSINSVGLELLHFVNAVSLNTDLEQVNYSLGTVYDNYYSNRIETLLNGATRSQAIFNKTAGGFTLLDGNNDGFELEVTNGNWTNLSNISYFANVREITSSHLVVDAFDDQNTFIGEFTFTFHAIANNVRDGLINVGQCNNQLPYSCSQPENQNFFELTYYFQEPEIYKQTNIDLFDEIYFSNNLHDYLPSGLTSTTSNLSVTTINLNGDYETTINIPTTNGTESCDFTITITSSQNLDFNDISCIGDFYTLGDPAQDGFYYNLRSDVVLINGSGAWVSGVLTISSCIPFLACPDCYHFDALPRTIPQVPTCNEIVCTPVVNDVVDFPIIPVQYNNPCEENLLNAAYANAENEWNQYIDNLTQDFINNYKSHCIESLNESFQKTWTSQEHHYTLYYYDQAGNLIKTIPPEGVELLPITSTSDALAQQVIDDRKNSTHTVLTEHRLATKYFYNSLNQLTHQTLPDHDNMNSFNYTLVNGLDAALVITDVDFTSPTIGMLVGYKPTTIAGQNFNRGLVYKTNDGGETWNRIYHTVSEDINAVEFNADESIGYAVGNNGAILYSLDGGSSWDLIDGYSDQVVENLNDVEFTGISSAIVVGDAGTVLTLNGSAVSKNNVTSSGITSSDNLTAVSYNGSGYCLTLVKADGSSLMYKSTDGINWSPLKIFTENINSAYVVDANTFFMGGDGGLLLTSTNQGADWRVVDANITGDIHEVFMMTNDVGVALIDQHLWQTFDNGVTWSILDASKNYKTLAIYYEDLTNDEMYLTAAVDNGEMAQVLLIGSNIGLINHSIPVTTGSSLNIIDAHAILVQSKPFLFALADDGKLYYTEDGSVSQPTWTVTITPFLNSQSIAVNTNGTDIKLMVHNPSGQLQEVLFQAGDANTPSATLFNGGLVYGNMHQVGGNIYTFNTSSQSVGQTSLTLSTSPPFGLFLYSAPTSSPLIVSAKSGGCIAFLEQGTIFSGINTGSALLENTENIRPYSMNDVIHYQSRPMAVANNGDVIKYNSGSFLLTQTDTYSKLNALVENDLAGEAIAAGDGGSLLNITLNSTNTLPINGTITANLNDIDFGYNYNSVVVAGDQGTQFSLNLGTNTPVYGNTNSTKNLNAAYAHLSGNHIVSGDNGEIFLGVSTMLIENKEIYPPQLNGVAMESATDAVIAGKKYFANYTHSGGNNWDRIIPNSAAFSTAGYNGNLETVETVSGKFLLAGMGGYLAESDLNGVLSSPVGSGTFGSLTITDVNIGLNGSGFATAGGISGGNGMIAKTTDYGQSWSFGYSGTHKLNKIELFESSGEALAVGENGSLIHFDGSSFVDISSVSGTTNDLYDIDFVDDNKGYIAGEDGYLSKTKSTSFDFSTAESIISLEDETMIQTNNLIKNIYALEVTQPDKIFLGGEYSETPAEVYARILEDKQGKYSTQFYYDKLGRIAVSQNSRQFNENPKKYSYSLYDELGRVVEAGEKEENNKKYISFDSDGYFECGGANLGLTDEITLAAWIRVDEPSLGNMYIVGKRTPGTFTEQVSLSERMGTIWFYYKHSSAPSHEYLYTSKNYADGKWHYLVGTVKGNDINLYIDGELVETRTTNYVGTQTIGGTGTVKIAAVTDYTGSANMFKGDIRQVSIWDEERNQNEIISDMTRAFTGSEDHLIAHFEMEEGANNQIFDITSTGLVGNYVGSGSPAWNEIENNGFSSIFGTMENNSIIENQYYLNFGKVFTSQTSGTGHLECNNVNLGITDEMTISCWMKTTYQDNNYRTLISKKNTTSNNALVALQMRNGQALLRYGQSSTSTLITTGTTNIADGEWHHIAGTVNGSEITVIVDGNQEGTESVSVTPTNIGGNGPLFIGTLQNQQTFTLRYVGDMKKVAIWKEARTVSEISADRYTEFTGNESNLLAYFPTDEGIEREVHSVGSANLIAQFGPLNDLRNAPVWYNEESQLNTNIQNMANMNPSIIDDTKLRTWISDPSGPRREVTHSYYDIVVPEIDVNLPISFDQNDYNLRKRIGAVTYEEVLDGDVSTYDYATHYDYDIHGNVTRLLQENQKLLKNSNPDIQAQAFKTMNYTYDLISGNVHQVDYQLNEPDRWSHRYVYDGDNRIQSVSTSENGIIWNEDARYYYYDHGPLSRVELGDNNVQGIDYAYTLQGWLKGVNSDLLNPNNDIGKDGLSEFAEFIPEHILTFDGIDDYVDLSQTSREFSDKATLEAWIKCSGSGEQVIVSKRTSGSIEDLMYISVTNGKARLATKPNNFGSTPTYADGFTIINDNQWHHVAGTINGTDLKIYVDGVEEGSATASGSATQLGGTGNMWIGGLYGGSSEYFQGQIKKVRVWNTVKTTNEIANNLNTQYNGSEIGIVGLYRCTEVTGTVIHDFAPLSIDGNLPANTAHQPSVNVNNIPNPNFGNSNPNKAVARDAIGFSLNYYAEDYSPISSTAQQGFSRFNSSVLGSDVDGNSYNLYNGNIGSMVTTLKKPEMYEIDPILPSVHPQATAYEYDQLNRLKHARAFTNVESSDNTIAGYNQWQFDNNYLGRYENEFVYDANGNIESQVRKDAQGAVIDDLTYQYATENGEKIQNRLYCVNDLVDYDNDDIDDMNQFVSALDEVNDGSNNYAYDATGQLIQDIQEEITNIIWRVDGKIKAIIRIAGSDKSNLIFDYDPMGNRIAKHVYGNQNFPDNGPLSPVFDHLNPVDWEKSTYYNRDAQGNVITTYEYDIDVANSNTSFLVAERNIYGSSRVGANVNEKEMIGATNSTNGHISGYIGKKNYELSNHLGNVLAVTSDRKYAVDDDSDGLVDYYEPDILLTYDYSPFGVTLPERSYDKNEVVAQSIEPDFHWDFDNGNLTELNGSGYNASVYNGASMASNGLCTEPNNSYVFDGVNDYGVIQDAAEFDFADRDFTIAVWASVKTASGWGNSILGKWTNGGQNPGQNEWFLGLRTGYNGSNPGAFTIEDVNQNLHSVSLTTMVALNQFYHLVALRDGDYLKIYLDGVLEGSTYIGNVVINNANVDMLIAKILDPQYSNVKVADIAIFERALTDYQVELLYQTTNCDANDDPALAQNYRYGFNGMEKDNEVYGGKGNSYSTEFRSYSPRLGRWLSMDPAAKKNSEFSPYNAFLNNPVYHIDPRGDDPPENFSKEKSAGGENTDIYIPSDANVTVYDRSNNIFRSRNSLELDQSNIGKVKSFTIGTETFEAVWRATKNGPLFVGYRGDVSGEYYENPDIEFDKQGSSFVGSEMNNNFEIKNTGNKSSAQVIQIVATDMKIPTSKYKNPSGYDQFVDGGKNSPGATQFNSDGKSAEWMLDSDPYYIGDVKEGGVVVGSTGSIKKSKETITLNVYDKPNAQTATSTVTFQTIIVSTNFYGSGANVVLGVYNWGWYNKNQIHTNGNVKWGLLFDESKITINKEYPNYQLNE